MYSNVVTPDPSALPQRHHKEERKGGSDGPKGFLFISVVIMSFIFWEGHPSPPLSVGAVSGLGAHVNMDLRGGPLLQA